MEGALSTAFPVLDFLKPFKFLGKCSKVKSETWFPKGFNWPTENFARTSSSLRLSFGPLFVCMDSRRGGYTTLRSIKTVPPLSEYYRVKPWNQRPNLKEPKRARCVFCKIDKPPSEFSEPQWLKAVQNQRAPPGKAKAVTCKECTDSQTDKITCHTCTKLKFKTEFSKRQRRHGTQARCRDCVRKMQEEDPNDSEPSSSDNDDLIMEHPYDFI